MLSLVLAVVLAQPPISHPTVRSRHHADRPTAQDFDALFDADVLLLGRIEELERKVRGLEAALCARETPAIAAPTGPSYEWRTIDGYDYWGYQDGPMFRYSHWRAPMNGAVRFAGPTRAGVACGR